MTKARDLASSGVTLTSTTTTADAALARAGGTMTGNLAMGTNLVDGVDVSARDAVLTDTTTKATAALPKAGGAMTGAITTNSTFDGVDIATRDGILSSTTTTATAALNNANSALSREGGAMTGAITTNSTFDGVDVGARNSVLTSTTTTANAALPKAGGAMTGAITTNSTFDGRDVAADGVLATNALPKAGGTVTGDVTFNTQIGLGAAPHATAPLNITTTNQHIRLNNGSELGVVSLLSSGELELWGHGANESINFRTGAGVGDIAMNIVGTKVGIGTSSPSTRLTVLASSANGIDLAQDPDNGANSGRLFFTTSGGTNSIRSTSGALQFSTGATAGSSSGTERMRITSTGVAITGNTITKGYFASEATNSTNKWLTYTHTDNTLRFNYNGAGSDEIVITSGGSVGIGTTAPTDSAWGGGSKEFAIDGTTGYSVIHLRGTGAGSTDTRFSHGVGDTKYFMAYDDVVGAHRMIVDALGNILVGKSVSDSAANGVELSQNGQVYITANGTLPFYINRRGTGGANEFARFADDGVTRGSISSAFANELIVSASGTNSSGILFSSANTIRPMKNGATSSGTQDLGASNGQWKDLYLSGGIQFDARSNKLQDYEEGTWTPDLRLASGGSVTYSARSGRYTKIGREVTAHCMIFNTAHVGSGLALIHGLPFTSNSESVGSAQMNQHSDSHSSDVGSINSVIQSSDAKIHMRATYNSNTSGPLYIQLQNFTYLRISLTYTAN